jgi:hypothetical protein
MGRFIGLGDPGGTSADRMVTADLPAERNIPIHPCRSIDDQLAFYEAIGFEVTLGRRRRTYSPRSGAGRSSRSSSP